MRPILIAAVAALLAYPVAGYSDGRNTLHGGGTFAGASNLGDYGWRNFVGQTSGRPANVTGVDLVGQPAVNAGFLTIEPHDAKNWYAGLFQDLAPLPPGVPLDKIRLRGRIAANKPGPVVVRIESSPGHWRGLVMEAPANAVWLEFDHSLAEATMAGHFDLRGERLRLVAAFRDTMSAIWSTPGENSLYLAELSLIIDN